jgi:hypothetical protein
MPTLCLILSIINIILLGIIYWLYRSTYYCKREAYRSVADDEHMRQQASTIEYLENTVAPITLLDSIKMANYDFSVFENDKTIYSNQKNSAELLDGDYSLNDVTTDIMNNNSAIDWQNVYVDDTDKILTVVTNPSTSIKELYGRKGVLNSNFKTDICSIPGNSNLDKKCQELSAENCNLTDCCVLLNGTKCVAGNYNGPLFLTENGVKVDQKYYYYKDICYGDCESAETYVTACGKYTKDSTNISKACMIQIFNNYGCPNPNPVELINDDMVKEYSETSLEYVDQYIRTATEVIAETYDNDNASTILCNGV